MVNKNPYIVISLYQEAKWEWVAFVKGCTTSARRTIEGRSKYSNVNFDANKDW
jgi:hypothetical protein